MDSKIYYVYIVANRRHSVLYTGVTHNLQQRYIQHLSGVNDGFTKRYNCSELLYFEQYGNIEDAICREKYIKKLSRANKESLISRMNPTRSNLAEEWKEQYFAECEMKEE